MNWPAECAAVIPCFNEETAIGPLVAAVRLQVPTVLVVDDGSADQTASAAREAGAEVLRHESNRGKGAALETGWACALERGFRWTITLDGDGQHSAEDIPAFFRCAEERGADLVIGNRMSRGLNPDASALPKTLTPDPSPIRLRSEASARRVGWERGTAGGSRMPLVRRFVNRWMSKRISMAAGRSLPDTQCGFRLMKLQAWRTLPIHAAHFEIESEVLLAFIAAGYKVEFVLIRVIYKKEQSKIHPVRDTVRWFRWWRRARRDREWKIEGRG